MFLKAIQLNPNYFLAVSNYSSILGNVGEYADSLTEHFDGWTAAGMNLGNMLEAKILVEVGGGVGSIEFPVANVVAQ